MKHFKSSIVLASLLGIGLISSATLYAQSNGAHMGSMRGISSSNSMPMEGMGRGGMMSGKMMGERTAMMDHCRDRMGRTSTATATNTTTSTGQTTGGEPLTR